MAMNVLPMHGFETLAAIGRRISLRFPKRTHGPRLSLENPHVIGDD